MARNKTAEIFKFRQRRVTRAREESSGEPRSLGRPHGLEWLGGAPPWSIGLKSNVLSCNTSPRIIVAVRGQCNNTARAVFFAVRAAALQPSLYTSGRNSSRTIFPSFTV